MANVFGPSSLFVRPASPVIILAKPGAFSPVAEMIRALRLTRVQDISGPLGIIRAMPWQFGSLATALEIPRFNMVTGILDGPTIASLAQDPNIAAIYEDKPMRVSQFPYAPPTDTYAVGVPQASVSAPVQTMYFTSTDTIRHLIGADVANAQGFTGAGVKAAVVDTGGMQTQSQLYRMTERTAIPGVRTDLSGHGGWVLSALGGTRAYVPQYSALFDRKIYCEGMAPGCNLLSVKGLDYVIGQGMQSQLIHALDIAAAEGADVINISWGGTAPKAAADPYLPVMQQLIAEGRLVVCAAGNSGPASGTVDSPGSLDPVLTVGAINAVANPTFGSGMFGAAGVPSNFSSRGPTPDGLTKPDTAMYGAIILSGVPTFSQMAVSYAHRVGAFSAIAGTSMSTPLVSGLLTCARQLYQERLGMTLTVTEVKAMLQALGQSKSNVTGWGMVTWPMIMQWVESQYGLTV